MPDFFETSLGIISFFSLLLTLFASIPSTFLLKQSFEKYQNNIAVKFISKQGKLLTVIGVLGIIGIFGAVVFMVHNYYDNYYGFYPNPFKTFKYQSPYGCWHAFFVWEMVVIADFWLFWTAANFTILFLTAIHDVTFSRANVILIRVINILLGLLLITPNNPLFRLLN